jgi:tRNA C32,U32 (ribose-2'-O)-methylase TrmJ
MESMPTAEELDRVCVVLVRARNPNNIGAVARAMHNFGFNWLRVVNDFQAPLEAARSAVDASEVMQSAVVFSSVAEAVADCTVVVGTTAVGERDLQHELLPLAQAAPRMRTELRIGEDRPQQRRTEPLQLAADHSNEPAPRRKAPFHESGAGRCGLPL